MVDWSSQAALSEAIAEAGDAGATAGGSATPVVRISRVFHLGDEGRDEDGDKRGYGGESAESEESEEGDTEGDKEQDSQGGEEWDCEGNDATGASGRQGGRGIGGVGERGVGAERLLKLRAKRDELEVFVLACHRCAG